IFIYNVQSRNETEVLIKSGYISKLHYLIIANSFEFLHILIKGIREMWLLNFRLLMTEEPLNIP
ncbi:MAG: hypothetical protein LBT24_07645, partial [Tannerella sp.]|nr:hypothetical protein [Tannerella sp.]